MGKNAGRQVYKLYNKQVQVAQQASTSGTISKYKWYNKPVHVVGFPTKSCTSKQLVQIYKWYKNIQMIQTVKIHRE